MIAQLSGKLAVCDLTEVVVDVHGVGYAVTVPLSTLDKMPLLGEQVTLLIHTHVREDAIVLYGFASKEERALFRLLIEQVSGIGPRLALNVLSCMSVEGFCNAISSSDLKALAKINGIGKRTAERMVVELRDKVSAVAPAAAFGGAAAAAASQGGALSRDAQDAIAALSTLGFKHDIATKVIQKLCEEAGKQSLSSEALIRKALMVLNS
ncbi:MAG: Holliday junction branch migration protein RuvA [Lentisphaeria bacterium]|jgi:Holliday junction DNA helicase RuvA